MPQEYLPVYLVSSINEALADSSDPPPPLPDYEDNASDSDLPVEQPPLF